MELAFDAARPLMSPAGGQVELTGWVQSDSEVAQVVLATRAGGLIATSLGARTADSRQQWRGLIPASLIGEHGMGVRIAARDRSGRATQIEVGEELPLPARQPWSHAEFRAALAAGEPILVCGQPSFDGNAVVGEIVLVEGWAYARAGIEACCAQFDDDPPIAGTTGLTAPGLIQFFGDLPGLDVAAFRIVCPTGPESGRSRTLVVTARLGDGSELHWGTQVYVDWELLHRQRLTARGRAPASLPEPLGDVPSLTIWPLSAGPGLKASLPRQNYVWSSVSSCADRSVTSGLKVAAGLPDGLIVFLDGDLELRAGALTALAAASLSEPGADAFYADHDHADEEGIRCAPYLKPDWSPEHLLALDYIGPVLAIRPALARAVLADDEPVTSLYDLALHMITIDARVVHVDRIVATVRRGASSRDARDARAAIERLARRRGCPVVIEDLDAERRKVSWPLVHQPLVSIVIPTDGRNGMISRCLRSIARRTTYPQLELIAVNTGAGALDLAGANGLEVRVHEVGGKFNFSTACNAGASQIKGEVVLFLNDDIEIESPDWIERMLDEALAPGVGPVAPKLLYPDRSIQHAGVLILKPPGGAVNVLRGLPEHTGGPRGSFEVVRNFSALSGACMMISREHFEAVNGFDEAFPIEWGDIDLCLRARAAGQRVVYTPHAVLIHYESQSRGGGTSPEDLRRFHERWGAVLDRGDRFWPFDAAGMLAADSSR